MCAAAATFISARKTSFDEWPQAGSQPLHAVQSRGLCAYLYVTPFVYFSIPVGYFLASLPSLKTYFWAEDEGIRHQS